MTATPPTLVPSIAPPVQIRGIALFPLREKWVRGGKVMFREARIPVSSDYEFQRAWKANKRAFYERGFCVRQENGAWFLQQWLAPVADGYALTSVGIERLAGLVSGRLNLTPDEPPPVILDLPTLPEHLEVKLFDYQIAPARQLYRALANGEAEWKYPGAWDCSDLGTGKTFQALAAAIATGLEIGVVCPLAVIPAWKNAFKHFGACPRFVINYESLRTGRRDYVDLVPWVDEKNRERKKFEWRLNPAETLLIFDESHNMKTTGSLNQGLGMAAIRQRFPLILISGTLASDPTHMRATGRVVGLHAGANDFFRFLHQHNCVNTGGKYEWKFQGGGRGRAALASIHRMVFPRRGARTRIADLGDRFPETQILAEAFDTGETQAIAKAFDDAEEYLKKLRASGMSEGRVNAQRQSAYMKAWHESERAKVPAIVRMVKSEQDEGRSVAVFVNFTDVREKLMAELKTDCAIFGGQRPDSRQRAIDAFQRDESRVIVANIDAGGVGVSLHDVSGRHPRTAIILPTNKVVSLTQALGRVHRAGGKSKSRQIVFFASGTVEETICDTVRKRMGQIATLNDGDMTPQPKF